MLTPDLFFETVQKRYVNQLPFVVYRKPNEAEIKGVLQKDNTIYRVEDYNETGFVLAPFDDAEPGILMPLEGSEILETIHSVKTPETQKSKTFTFSDEDKEQHIELVKKSVENIEKGVFEKVVVSREEALLLSGFNLIRIFERLLNKYPRAFVYCWYHPKVGLWLGATPETLMKIEGYQLEMMALAGTQDYKGTLEVTWEEKERQEQQIVTDFIVDNLKPLVETVKVSGVETVKAGNVLHLMSMITATFIRDAFNLKKVLSVLHPTPAVCGMPKLAAKKFIMEHESYKRTFYTGYLGELNYGETASQRTGSKNIENSACVLPEKSTQLYVNLRCMQIKEHTAFIYVGGGITKDSDPEKEWEETVLKSKVIKSIL